MLAASLLESVFWKWNYSYPEASLDGVHYWLGVDDGCSSCLWLPAPHRTFLLQVNNKQQKARKNSRTGSIVWLGMPGALNVMCIRAAPFPSIFLGYCGVLIYILPLRRAQDTFTRHSAWIFKRGNFDWYDTGSQGKEHPFLAEITFKQSSHNIDGTGISPFLFISSSTRDSPGQLAKYLQAKNIPS